MSFYRNFFKAVKEINERNTFEISCLFELSEYIDSFVFSKQKSILFLPYTTPVQTSLSRAQPLYIRIWESYCQANAPPITAKLIAFSVLFLP